VDGDVEEVVLKIKFDDENGRAQVLTGENERPKARGGAVWPKIKEILGQ